MRSLKFTKVIKAKADKRFYTWLWNHFRRVEKDLAISVPLLVEYLEEPDNSPIIDVLLYRVSMLYDTAYMTPKDKLSYIHSYVSMYRREFLYEFCFRSASGVKEAK